MSINPFSNNLITNIQSPFKNDYTEKLEIIAKSYTKVIESQLVKKPLVLTIDAPWGMGKSCFVDMWGQLLINQKTNAIKFDAWKNDHTDNPLLALIAELTNQLKNLETIKKRSLKKLIAYGSKLCLTLLPATMKAGTTWIVEYLELKKPIEKLTEAVLKNAEELIKKQLLEFNKKSSTILKFKDILKDIAKINPLFIFIDELDRCKPTFAIQILEIVKHIFDIPGICCIISTNIKGLSNSVQITYGHQEGDAKEYLERFVDRNISLPPPDFDKFVEKKLHQFSWNIKNKNTLEFFIETIKSCCKTSTLSLRVIKKYIWDIQLFLTSNDNLEAKDKIPEIYYACIAEELAKERLSHNYQYTNLTDGLAKQEKYKWIRNFFNASKSKDDLDKIASNLFTERNRQKSHYTQEENDRRIMLESLHTELLSLYGGVSRILIPSSPNQDYLYTVKNYVNHYSIARNLMQLFVVSLEYEEKKEHTDETSTL